MKHKNAKDLAIKVSPILAIFTSLVFGYSQLIYEPKQNPLKKLERASSSPVLDSKN